MLNMFNVYKAFLYFKRHGDFLMSSIEI